MASKDQTPAETRNGEVSKLSPFQMFIRNMAEMATLDESQARPTGDNVVAIMNAENEEDMWDADDLALFNAQKLSGCELQVTSFEVKFGTSDSSDIVTPFTTPDGKQMYLLVHSFRLSEKTDRKDVKLPKVGEEFTWNTSASNVVGKLFWMLRNGWFDNDAPHGPVQFRIQGTKLTGGRTVEKLKKIENGPITIPGTVEPSF